MSRGNIGLLVPTRDRDRAERPSSQPKKRRNSSSKPEGLSLTIQDYGRKASVQPSKKLSRSKFDSSNDASLNKIFRKGSRERRVNTEAGLSLEDYRVPDMMAAYKSKDYAEAISLGRDVLAEHPKSLDALYIVGLASSMVDRHESTIKHFETLLSLKPQYKKNVYLLLSIAYKKLGKTDASFRVLNMALRHFDRFFEAYVNAAHQIYRAKLFQKQNKLEEAFADYSKALEIDDQKFSAKIGLGDICKARGDYRAAIAHYSSVLDQDQYLMDIVGLKRIGCYVHLKEFARAAEDLEQVASDDQILRQNPRNVDALYQKAAIARAQKENKLAVVIFEEVVNLNTNDSLTLKSLHDIALIRMEERDVYQAYHTLDRLERTPSNVPYFSKAKTFLEGAISMVKKKYVEGVQHLSTLINDEDLHVELRPLVYSYRAYGYFCQGSIEEAISDYEALQHDSRLSECDEYNLLLCRGIMKAREKKWGDSEKLFRMAQSIYPTKIEPRFYIEVDSTEQVLRLSSFLDRRRAEHLQLTSSFDVDYSQSKYYQELSSLVLQMIENLEKIIAENDSCPNLIFQVGYLKLSIVLPSGALENFAAAIDKYDDHSAEHFIWKGIAHCMCNQYNEGLQSFRFAVSLSPGNYQAALCKGRCYLHLNEYQRAMYAFEEFLEGSPEQEFEIKLHLAHFFFALHELVQSRKLYEEALEIRRTEALLRELVKNYILEKNLFAALEKLEMLQAAYPRDAYSFDIGLLHALKACSNDDFEQGFALLKALLLKTRNGFVFKEPDLVFYQAVAATYLGKLRDAASLFERARALKYGGLATDKLSEVLEEEARSLEPLFQQQAEDEDLNPLGQTFTCLELDYNLALCQMLDGRWDRAIEKLCAVNQYPHAKPAVDALLFAISSSERDFTQEKQLAADVFPSNNRLCGIYKPLAVLLPSGVSLVARLSFCLPTVALPDTGISVGIEILEKLDVGVVENRPEAPWVRRVKENIIFTTNIISTEASEVSDVQDLLQAMQKAGNEKLNTKVKLNAEKLFETRIWEEQNKKKDDSKAAHAARSIIKEVSSDEDSKPPAIKNLRDELKLDKNTEDKLAKLLQQKKQ